MDADHPSGTGKHPNTDFKISNNFTYDAAICLKFYSTQKRSSDIMLCIILLANSESILSS